MACSLKTRLISGSPSPRPLGVAVHHMAVHLLSIQASSAPSSYLHGHVSQPWLLIRSSTWEVLKYTDARTHDTVIRTGFLGTGPRYQYFFKAAQLILMSMRVEVLQALTPQPLPCVMSKPGFYPELWVVPLTSYSLQLLGYATGSSPHQTQKTSLPFPPPASPSCSPTCGMAPTCSHHLGPNPIFKLSFFLHIQLVTTPCD